MDLEVLMFNSVKRKMIWAIKKLLRGKYCDSKSYTAYLRRLGVQVGENTYFWTPHMHPVDEGRAHYIRIGKNCMITRGVLILAHDYSWTVMRKSHNDFVPDGGGKVVIGDNVFLGMNAIVLKNVTIGSNVIVGAGSVVTHDLPDNTVCAGNPCSVISSMDEYYLRKSKSVLDEAYKLYWFYLDIHNRKPIPEDLLYFGYLFTKPNSEERYNLAKKINIIADDNQSALDNYMYLENQFDNYFEFERYCVQRREQESN